MDRVNVSTFRNMKELRPAGTSVPISFIFDPRWLAVLLLGGGKARNWRSWYGDNIPVAERRYPRWLETSAARRLAEIRKAHGHVRQADVAALMGVSQARVSQLESGGLSHTELGTLQSYVAALGGHLRIVADFGEDSVELSA